MSALESTCEGPRRKIDTADLDPAIGDLLDRKRAAITAGPYQPQRPEELRAALARFFARERPGARVENIRRLSGGGSKEQFVFDLAAGETATRHVLRLDPLQSTIETDRQREFEILRAMRGVVPAPEAQAVDPRGVAFGRPALIMSFESGVTQPTNRENGNVSGMGMVLDAGFRGPLGTQFLEHLAAMHLMDWRAADLPSFGAPTRDPFQAARWQVNWWSRVWREDHLHPTPAQSVIEHWLLENLPACRTPVVVHGDYRPGNFLFDETTKRFTAILDWELAHLGDHHEDLAFIVQGALGAVENGTFLACGLMTRDEMLERYSRLTGFDVCPKTLRFYEVLVRYKIFVLMLATSVKAAQFGHYHQDTHLTWLATAGHVYQAELCDMILEEIGR